MTPTDTQIKVHETYQRLGSVRAVAKELGMHRKTVQCHLAAAARRGLSPSLAPVATPAGMALTKTTVQYGADGKLIQEWRRQAPVVEDMEAVVAALEDRVAAKAPVIRPPPKADSDLLLEIPIPDHHVGMYAWAAETGADYDSDIATSLLTNGVSTLIGASPKLRKIALVVLGDYFHSDDRSGTTEKSGHKLDVDSRFARRLDAGVSALTQCIEMAATAAPEVEVVVISGNHDWHSAKWLARVLAAYYRSIPHVTVRTDPRERQYLRHGKVLLGYAHGDTQKAKDLPLIMAREAKADWAATEFRRCRIGHWHQRALVELQDVVVETLPTLAAPDAYAHGLGVSSGRAISGYLWSAQWGLRAHMERTAAELERKP